MPEICEAEKLVQQLKSWTGKTLKHIEAVRDRNGNLPAAKYVRNKEPGVLSKDIKGAKIQEPYRLGKQIVIPYHGAQGGFIKYLLIHLGHTGWFLPYNDAAKAATMTAPIYANFIHTLPESSIRAKFVFENGEEHAFLDPRTFSRWRLFANKADLETNTTGEFGPDWLDDQTKAYQSLVDASSKRPNAKIKTLMLDQKIAAGLGNYLCCEAMHRANVNPFSRGVDLSHSRMTALIESIILVLQESLTSDDHSHWKVFKKSGELCSTCGTARIARQKDSKAVTESRSSYFCPVCQPLVCEPA